MVFPRSHWLAALQHATESARRHHDDRTRALGLYHLFRLPTQLESQIHRCFIEVEQDGEFKNGQEEILWKGLDVESASSTSVAEGPVDLGIFDPRSQKDLERLGSLYRAAFEAKVSCIPYFQLKQ